jgi:hypothetical protein
MIGAGGEPRGHLDVHGEHDRDPPLLRLGQVPAHPFDLVGLEEALADRVALRGEEGEEHPSTDEQVVDSGQQMLDDSELVGHLRAAQHDRVRPFRRLRQSLEDRQLS